MKAEWLANVDGQEYGPYTWQQMLQMAAEGRVPSDLPVRRASDKRWFKASQVPGLVTPAAPPAAVSPAAASSAKKGDSHLKRAKPLAAAASVAAPPLGPPAPPSRTAAVAPAAAASPGGPFPIIVAEPRPKSAQAADPADQPHVPPRGRNRLLLAGIVVGGTAVVLLMAATIVWLVWLRGDGARQPEPVAAAASEANPNQDEDTDTAGESKQVTAAAAAKDEQSGDGPTKGELAAQAKLVQSVSKWQSLAGFKSASVSSASLEVTRVWRTDAAGQDQAKQSGKKFVCVEVAISNKSPSPLKYRGWNSYGPNGAILADESKQVLPLVPVAKTPDMKRMTTTSVPGNGTMTDVLVFAAPASDDEVLHLVLPYGVFYSNVRPPYRAIELTPDIINVDLAAMRAGSRTGSEREDIVREPTAGPAPSGDDAPPAGAKDTAAAPTPPKGVPLGKDGKTPSIKDLIDNDPGTPVKPDEPAGGKNDPKKPATKTDGKKPESPKKPENPFEPKPSDDSSKPPPAVPKGKSE